MEYIAVINGVEYTKVDIVGGSVTRPLMDDLSIGNACEAELKLQFFAKGEIPTMAPIVVYVSDEGERRLLGSFYISERYVASNGMMSVIAYDSMLMADRIWVPDQKLEFPMGMADAVSIIANLMGVAIDSRCAFSNSYTIDYPANDYTLRNILQFIAAAHGGNFVITANNELLLIPLVGSCPESTNYLVTNEGSAITFGGVRILV